MSEIDLRHLLLRAIRALCPRRARQELLLDLGERKKWTDDDLVNSVGELARWLRDELHLPAGVPGAAAAPATGINLQGDALRDLGNALCEGGLDGVARWKCGLAPAVGSGAKAFANSVSGGLQGRRRDHRWLASIARALHGPDPLEDSWVFHRRTPSNVSALLGRLGARTVLDAGDALVVFSLVALWQRRRAPSKVRGNRGTRRSRRVTPKPVAALQGELVGPGQLRPLQGIAAHLGGSRGRALLRLALDAALTEAHLAPHAARRTQIDETGDGETLLVGVARIVDESASLLGLEEAAAYRFRVARMRSWRDQAPQPPPGRSAREIPYVAVSLALETARESGRPDMRINVADAGMLMLLPLLRSRGFEVHP